MLVLSVLACTSHDHESEAILAVKSIVTADLGDLRAASEGVRDAAPAMGSWNAASLADTRQSWKDARVSYERVEGAIAVLFPELDAATDERYDGFIAEAPDAYLFDGEGVTGVHGIERILWADAHPAWVVEFESALTGYVPAAFPASEQEVGDFKTSLAQRLVDDVGTMQADFEPLALDTAAAYEGVVGSMAEQVEKISLAATGEDESRYAQHTLADMRANLAGGRAIYGAFSGWIVEAGGASIDLEITDGFDRIEAAYAALPGEALPAVPETWNPDAPSEADLATDYGQLWTLLSEESDPAAPGSLVERMVAGAATVALEVSP